MGSQGREANDFPRAGKRRRVGRRRVWSLRVSTAEGIPGVRARLYPEGRRGTPEEDQGAHAVMHLGKPKQKQEKCNVPARGGARIGVRVLGCRAVATGLGGLGAAGPHEGPKASGQLRKMEARTRH